MLIRVSELNRILQQMSQNGLGNFTEVIAPIPTNDNGSGFSFHKVNNTENLNLGGFRSIDPLKILLYNVRERVYPMNEPANKRIVVGVKACDIQALLFMDRALINEDFSDYAYKKWRDTTYLVSSDCTEIHPSCNCVLVDGKPYCDDGYDLNLSLAGEYYLLKVGSKKGEELLTIIKESCVLTDDDGVYNANVEGDRKKIIARLQTQNQKYINRSSLENLRNKEKEIWKELSNECVGCGACSNICPTCYCLILNDESDGNGFIKVRSYDSCQVNGYAKVAGGGSPRPKMFQRFRNRYLCKFDYTKQNFGKVGCTGCGRCTEACAAKIDFREVIHGVQNYTLTT
jgi:sulfhydrogenase subunit beta (sulfur reductase)